jgi:hypothetical protein
MTNSEFNNTDACYRAHCKMANVKPTRRQASKFRRGTGAAWKISILDENIHVPKHAKLDPEKP